MTASSSKSGPSLIEAWSLCEGPTQAEPIQPHRAWKFVHSSQVEAVLITTAPPPPHFQIHGDTCWLGHVAWWARSGLRVGVEHPCTNTNKRTWTIFMVAGHFSEVSVTTTFPPLKFYITIHSHSKWFLIFSPLSYTWYLSELFTPYLLPVRFLLFLLYHSEKLT